MNNKMISGTGKSLVTDAEQGGTYTDVTSGKAQPESRQPKKRKNSGNAHTLVELSELTRYMAYAG